MLFEFHFPFFFSVDPALFLNFNYPLNCGSVVKSPWEKCIMCPTNTQTHSNSESSHKQF